TESLIPLSRCVFGTIACFAELAARREKNDFAKSKISKKFFKKLFSSQTPGHLVVVGRLRLYANSA
ncbi:MAG: hypothetical protein VX955_10830, partial [Pseudomonadota bacterium]|nr:hypothetical protein [Pseudomonadota bacterium]